MVNLTFDYAGRTIVVTGAARGVGRAIAERFRQAGGTVFCVDADEEAVTDTAKEIGATGVAADISDSETVEALLDRVVADTGRVDFAAQPGVGGHVDDAAP
ncbi:SDR family NAD(P)-dependent oxidoreductase [Amycolatopsis thermoflava]